MITGDEHVGSTSPEVVDATYKRKDSIAATLKPEYIVRHDLFDGKSVNHHEENNVSSQFMKIFNGTDSVEDELNNVVKFVSETSSTIKAKNLIVGSNHNDWLDKWLNNPKSAFDLKNAEILYFLRTNIFASMKNGENKSGFQIWFESEKRDFEYKFIERHVGMTIMGIEVGLHGDIAGNGAKGSARAFSKYSFPTIIGHSHSPNIDKGCWQVGTSTYLELSYNSNGPTSWMNTHCIIYPNGERQLLNIIEGEWHL